MRSKILFLNICGLTLELVTNVCYIICDRLTPPEVFSTPENDYQLISPYNILIAQ